MRALGREAGARPVPRPFVFAVLAAALLALAAAGLLNERRLEPFTTWYYVFAWYPTLAAFDALVAIRRRGFLLLGRPRSALSLLAWSVPAWMLFELLNLRLQNWYYVFVPDQRASAWAGICLSFATVLPAVFLAATATAEYLPVHRPRWRPLRITPRRLRALQATGVAMLALPLAWPATFFPLVWGTLTLILEPSNYRRDRSRSLLADLEAGRPGRLLALLAGGAAIGLLWELYNVSARGKWIYTVPGLEELKVFEMPLLGFVGFPVFALECFALVQWLVLHGFARDLPWPAVRAARATRGAGTEPVGPAGRVAGPVADPVAGPVAPSPSGAGLTSRPGDLGRAFALACALAFVVALLLAMERYTVSSTTPHLRDLPGLLPSQVEDLTAWGITSPFALAELEPGELVRRVPGAEPRAAEEWVRAARLSTLRGIGTTATRHLWRLGVRSIEELAATDPEALAVCLVERVGQRINVRRVRVWVEAAQRAVGVNLPGPRVAAGSGGGLC